MVETERVQSELKGTTLRVYWAVLKKGSEGAGPRELMRELELSSPSVAVYHLEKLKNLGLVEKEETGSYIAKEQVKVEVFSDYVRVVGMMLPRYLFYSVLFTTMLVSYLLIYPIQWNSQTLVTLIFGLTACLITWGETIRVWFRRPF
jgi:DNA-binding transcriptional ArsR family regulator